MHEWVYLCVSVQVKCVYNDYMCVCEFVCICVHERDPPDFFANGSLTVGTNNKTQKEINERCEWSNYKMYREPLGVFLQGVRPHVKFCSILSLTLRSISCVWFVFSDDFTMISPIFHICSALASASTLLSSHFSSFKNAPSRKMIFRTNFISVTADTIRLKCVVKP